MHCQRSSQGFDGIHRGDPEVQKEVGITEKRVSRERYFMRAKTLSSSSTTLFYFGTTLFHADKTARLLESESGNLESLCRISRNRCRLEDITTPGLK